MSKFIFITGTGTDVGKTYISALIAKKLHDAGFSCAYFKAAMSGNIVDKTGHLIPGDAKFVRDFSGIKQSLESMCPYVYEKAVSPHLASRIEGNPVDLAVVREGLESISKCFDYVIMEGSGGILCPIEYDTKKIWLWEMIKEFNLSTIIVTDAGLGTINSVGLTADFMANKKIPIKGIIMNHYHKGDEMEEDNILMCEELTGVKVIAKVSEGDAELDIDVNYLASLFDE